MSPPLSPGMPQSSVPACAHADHAGSPPCPPDLVDAVAREAVRDAEGVGMFLKELGLLPEPGITLHLPADFLLDLGAALRLLDWESIGLAVHLEAGLPEAEQALREAFMAPVEDYPRAGGLARRVVALFIDRFAWHARRDLDATVALDDHADEEALLDALAALLWRARHARKHVLMASKEHIDG